jgi:NhaP-type Na+/H+ or K+/H+ antiporter
MHGSKSIEIVDTIFNVLYFFLLGTLLPFASFQSVGWTKLLLLAGWAMLIRRLPVILLFYRWIPSIGTLNDAAFVGWFAPAGVDTILCNYKLM